MYNDPYFRYYIIDQHINSLKWEQEDHISCILKTKAVTTFTEVPKDYIHYSTRDLLYLLHKLNIRPSL